MTAKAVNRAGVVTLDCGPYRFTLHVLRDRCLAPLELPVDRTVSHTVVREVNGEDDETFLVAENGCVELEELATNDILAGAAPALPVPGGLQGLCPTCGKNLNEGPCVLP
ncbi:MAG: YceD family protein [Angelakisella sp.]